MKSLFFWKKKSNKEDLTKLLSEFTLYVHLKDEKYDVFTKTFPIDTKISCIEVFYGFYKWFYFKSLNVTQINSMTD